MEKNGTFFRTTFVAIFLMAFAGLLAGCGGDDDDDENSSGSGGNQYAPLMLSSSDQMKITGYPFEIHFKSNTACSVRGTNSIVVYVNSSCKYKRTGNDTASLTLKTTKSYIMTQKKEILEFNVNLKFRNATSGYISSGYCLSSTDGKKSLILTNFTLK